MAGITQFGINIAASTTGEEQLRQLESTMAKIQDRMGTAGKTAVKTGDDFGGMASKIKAGIQDPMGAATDAMHAFIGKAGAVGLILGGTVTVAAAAGAAVFNLARAYGDLYEQQSNNAVRLGVSIREYGLFSRVSTEAGLSSDALVGTMRGLSKALSENSDEGQKAKEAMSRVGIAATDAFGAAKPMRDILLQIADRLGQIQNPAEKAEVAIKLMGKGALEVLPLMNSELRQQMEALERSGAGWNTYSEAVGKATDKIMDSWDRRWSKIKKGISEGGARFFLAITDPSTAAQLQAAENRERYEDAPRRQMDILEGRNLPAGFAMAGVSTAQMQASDLQRRRQLVGSLTGSGLQSRLAATKKDLDDAIQNADVEGVRRLQAEYKALEQAIKAAADAAKDGVFTARGLKDPIRINSLLRPGERTSGMQGQFVAKNGPSLLRPGETANLGMLGIDAATWQRNQGNALAENQNTADFEARKMEASAFPGFELQAAQRAAAIRIAGLEQAKNLGMDIFQAQLDQNRILQDFELAKLNIQRQRLNELKQQGGSLFDAITAGGGGIQNYIKGLGLGTGRTLFSNTFAQIGSGLSGKFSLPGQGTAESPNFLGKILQGTPFGMDPNKLATDLNTTATVQNSATMQALTAALGGGLGGGTSGLSGMFSQLSGLGSAPSVDLGTLSRMGMTSPADQYGGGPLASVPTSTGSKMSAMKGIGYAAGAAAAGFGVYSGIKMGGARGALTATGSALGGLAMIPGPQQPFIAAAAMATAMISAILPDPKVQRTKALLAEASARQFDDPVSSSYLSDTYGKSVDYNKRGDTRVYVEVKAMDSQSFIDAKDKIAEAMRQAIGTYAPFTQEMISAVSGN